MLLGDRSNLDRPFASQQLAVSDNSLVTVQKNLYALKDFLDQNPYLFHSSPSEASPNRPPVAEQEAWRVCLPHSNIRKICCSHLPQAEQNSVSELMALLSRTIEALSFVLLLSDYRLGDLISQ